jgi:hypothetical protein
MKEKLSSIPKSKFDLFVFEDKGKRFVMMWDCALDGVDQWFHSDGKQCWRKTGRKYRSVALRKWKLVDRIPEHVHRSEGWRKWL